MTIKYLHKIIAIVLIGLCSNSYSIDLNYCNRTATSVHNEIRFVTGQFNYNINKYPAYIVGCSSNPCPAHLTISAPNNYEPLIICEGAFESKNLFSVTMPSTVSRIVKNAFKGNYLTSVEIPTGVRELDDSAFKDNIYLTDVTFQNGVQTIGPNVFSNTQIDSISLPVSVNTIKASAFNGMGLNYVSLGRARTIEASAFSNNNLTSLTLPSSLTDIGPSAFANNKIASLVIPSSIKSLGTSAFANNELTSVVFQGNRPITYSSTFSENSDVEGFYYCPNTIGWPTVPINGMTPEVDENCGYELLVEYSNFDLDKNGTIDALTDGLIMLRYGFGLRGESLIEAATAPDAKRTTAEEIEAHITSH
jgi:hypothetical protein